ncbi:MULTISPECIES: M20 family metallo-hydrolase [unclassified Achromobacter]|uniref:M20 family metallo-hydrolase n=1 Tax=unclassified Achromobacter TaxID=2626865 RepID=UPI000B51B822|nr:MULTISPECIES: M20 family metallo-hydrolase [unclassified Achromobacter]OWT73452.1 Zn-dependent hydrolase [Achromobacter sp. HZ34]OWT79629.1 Zn-dependent hydrolase [Achromobacter sp. HZ28]
MNQSPSRLVSQERLMNRLMAMARIGATAKGGVDRAALSAEDAAAQALMAEWGVALGLHASRDAAGNFFLRWEAGEGAPLLSGSHLDSQPTGGRYDGVYGVIAALEAVQAMQEAGIAPRRPVEIVAWMNEEGSRFAPGMMGAAVYGGARALADILPVQDKAGISVEAALATTAAALPDIAMRTMGIIQHTGTAAHVNGAAHAGSGGSEESTAGGTIPYAYVEAHIEQGPELERAHCPVGIVSGIQGKHTFRVTVRGEAAHAGTSTRAERRDALLAATAMVQDLARAMHDDADIVKFTVGRFDVTPSAPSVVASQVLFSIDLRHPDSAELQHLSALVAPTCAAAAGPCEVDVTRLSAADSLTFPLAMQARLRSAAERLDLPYRDLISAAGHDARYLHPICPSAMLFVPSHDGITHNEAEFTEPADLYAGACVLADVLAELATLEGQP